MFKFKRMLGCIVALTGCFMLPSMALGAGTDVATVTITATVDQFAEWAVAAPSIVAGDWVAGNINAVNQAITASLALTLYANANTAVAPTAGASSGILTNGSETLSTSYKITGDVVTPDGAYKAAGIGAGAFFNAGNTYSVTHVPGDGSYALALDVKAVSPNNRAPDAGNYSCGVVLTASW